jgi:hypothetical protein
MEGANHTIIRYSGNNLSDLGISGRRNERSVLLLSQVKYGYEYTPLGRGP